MSEDFPRLVRVRFQLEAIEAARLPSYAGSAWRGLLGHSLRRTVCVTRQPTCDGCLLIGTCSYSVFFESPPPDEQTRRRYTALPHPFVLDVETRPERDVAAGEILQVGVNLIGPAIDLLPYLIQAMTRAGEHGIGREGGRFALREVFAEEALGSDAWRLIYDTESVEYRRVVADARHPVPMAPASSELTFQTPLRIKRRGHFVGAAELAPEDLLRNLTTRLASLAAFYGGSAEPFDWRTLADAAKDVRIRTADLSWSDWTRFSSRQRTTMQMGGLVGALTLDGTGLAAFWPALWLGQWIHVGKGTSFGLGKFRLTPAAGGQAS